MTYDFLNIAASLERVDALRAEIDAERPLTSDQIGRAAQRLRLEWTYHSNAIEGNSYEYGETVAILMEGVTAHGKPLKDALDIQRHAEVLTYLEEVVRGEERLSLKDIRGMHEILMGKTYSIIVGQPDGTRSTREEQGGAFKRHPNHVLTPTGEKHFYATPEETPARMQDLIDWYAETWPHVETGEVPAVPFVADFHHRFVQIHPFPDGNGRLGRILMNLILMRRGHVPAVLRQERRSTYYGALSQADSGDLRPLAQFIADELTATMALYLSALRGEPDPAAFEKRVALLNIRVETSGADAPERSERTLHELSRHFIVPYLSAINEGVESVSKFFRKVDFSCSLLHGDQPFLSNHLDDLIEQMMNRDWRSFQAQWELTDFRSAPEFSTTILVDGEAKDSSFTLSRGGVRTVPTISIRYDDRKNSKDAEVAAGEHLDALLESIEVVQKRVEEGEAQ